MPSQTTRHRPESSPVRTTARRGRAPWRGDPLGGGVGTLGIAVSGLVFLGTVGWWVRLGPSGTAEGRTRVEAFAEALRHDPARGGSEAAEEWLAAGAEALARPREVSLPFRETGDVATGAYRFSLLEGQVLDAMVTFGEPDAAFVELYRLADDEEDPPVLVAEGDPSGGPIRSDGGGGAEYVLRLLPRPSAGGSFAVEIDRGPLFPFPVAERGPEAVISRFGAPRDGGLRPHEGVDVLAPRGTPVLSVTTGLVYEVGTSTLGGNYVWVQDWSRGKDIYYAHLERSWVEVGMVVRAGDPIGSIGNTGNAEHTVPHLHFGIYDQDRRAADPYPYIAQP